MSKSFGKVLILFAHPAFARSRVNRVLVEQARRIDGVTVHDLYERYPDLDIDVAHEQELLGANDVIVMQHPFYWYSTPSILKQWQDLVLEHGWAYGREGRALRGKLLLNAVTAGGGEESYTRSGPNRYTIRELLAPIEQTAVLCGMRWLAPFVVHGTHRLDDAGVHRHAADYAAVLEALRDGRLDVEAACRAKRLNSDLAALIGD
jgi:glutathione-regulated potassium-efflux system ancillary protein KefG